MAGNGGGGGGPNSGRAAGPSNSAPENTIFPNTERHSRWRGCLGGLSCFGSQKRGKRIVPSSRIPDGNGSVTHGNGPQAAGLPNQTTTLTPSLLAPPSSPASFTHSALPSTAQSPSCFLSISANSPGGPSSTMFATGPYAHETQLVSPPVFSTFTTEPSTAPLTPPPELAHLTTPSSPEVPYARFLSSSLDIKTSRKENGGPYISSGYVSGSDLQATYPLYPGSPSSSFISPASGTPRTGLSSPFPEREIIPTQWKTSLSAHESPYSRSQSSKIFGLNNSTSNNFMLSPDSSFFYPATSAQFYLDQAQQSFSPYSHCGGRLSVSREADVHGNGGHRRSKACKQDVEEIEAYRASFGFSADELITTQSYVEISDPADDSFSMSPFASNDKLYAESCPIVEMKNLSERAGSIQRDLPNSRSSILPSDQATHRMDDAVPDESDALRGRKLRAHQAEISNSNGHRHAVTDEELFSKMRENRISRSFRAGSSVSDAEVDYRRSKSLRGSQSILAWHS